MSCDILSSTSGANAIPSAVVAVPVLVFNYFVDVVIVVCPNTESTKLAFTLIVDVGDLCW